MIKPANITKRYDDVFCSILQNQCQPTDANLANMRGRGVPVMTKKTPAGEKMVPGQSYEVLEKRGSLAWVVWEWAQQKKQGHRVGKEKIHLKQKGTTTTRSLTEFSSRAPGSVLSPRTWPNSGPSGVGTWRCASVPSSRRPALTPSKYTRFEPARCDRARFSDTRATRCGVVGSETTIVPVCVCM